MTRWRRHGEPPDHVPNHAPEWGKAARLRAESFEQAALLVRRLSAAYGERDVVTGMASGRLMLEGARVRLLTFAAYWRAAQAASIGVDWREFKRWCRRG